jgi:hypothetical protein
MNVWQRFQKVPQAPTNPQALPLSPREGRDFDVAQLYSGPLDAAAGAGVPAGLLDEKARQAYFWIVNTAIISPFYDLEYSGSEPARVFRFGDSKCEVRLPTLQRSTSTVPARCPIRSGSPPGWPWPARS